MDVDGDDVVSPADVLIVINYINRQGVGGGEGERTSAATDSVAGRTRDGTTAWTRDLAGGPESRDPRWPRWDQVPLLCISSRVGSSSRGGLVTRLCLVTHCPRGSASLPAGRAGKTVHSQAEPGNEEPQDMTLRDQVPPSDPLDGILNEFVRTRCPILAVRRHQIALEDWLRLSERRAGRASSAI